MTPGMAVDLSRDALLVALILAGPIMAIGMIVGLAISVFQAVTQLQEQTLTFVPKILGVFAVSAIFGPWMIGTMVSAN